MRLKRIEAKTVGEAMRRLRQELGDDAVILHTKTVPAAGLTGLLRGPRVEILGAIDEAVAGVGAALPAPGPPPAAAAERAAIHSPASPPDHRAEIARRLAHFQAAVPTAPLHGAALIAGGDSPPPLDGVTFAPPRWAPVNGRPRRIAFVGPTGAGKTTTLAKVAARAQLDHGQRVSLVTIDTYRIGAVPQLASYAEILGVRLAVAHTPPALREALDRAEADLVFIDTVGRSPLGGGVESILPFMEAARADEVCLVMSATTRVADSVRAAASFARLGPDRLCMTKLDETDFHQAVAAVSQATSLPLAWLGTGQSVPDDLEEARPERVAALAGDGRAA